MTIEEVSNILDELAEELPEEFYKELNGGILLLPEKKISSAARNNDLYTMGLYHRSSAMGRYIAIYYGSFFALYENAPAERWKEELRNTLRHEFTHHLESLAGERGLEKKDDENMRRYENHLPMEKL